MFATTTVSLRGESIMNKSTGGGLSPSFLVSSSRAPCACLVPGTPADCHSHRGSDCAPTQYRYTLPRVHSAHTHTHPRIIHQGLGCRGLKLGVWFRGSEFTVGVRLIACLFFCPRTQTGSVPIRCCTRAKTESLEASYGLS